MRNKMIHLKENTLIHIAKSFLLHLVIASIYLGFTCYEFVVTRKPNPIGVGLQQVLLMIIHLAITLVIFSIILTKASRKKIPKLNLIINVLTVFTCCLIYIMFSNTVWRWLWQLKGM